MKIFLFITALLLSMVSMAALAEPIDLVATYDLLDGLLNGLPVWVKIPALVVFIFTWVTATTPSKSSNKYINGALKIFNVFAGNVGKNKNADAV